MCLLTSPHSPGGPHPAPGAALFLSFWAVTSEELGGVSSLLYRLSLFPLAPSGQKDVLGGGGAVWS